jgi:hypothetical protein
MNVIKALLLLVSVGSTLPLLAGEQRHHAAHEHGVGKLDIAQEGSVLHIVFDSPAANLLGFEHAPRTKQEHETLEQLLSRLKDGTGLFSLPNAAGCRLVEADVETPLQDHNDDKEEHHSGHGKESAEHKHHEEEQHAESEGGEHADETHADITASYRFACEQPDRLKQIRVQLFEAFPMTERLQVQYITDKGQGATRLSASQPLLRF